MITGLLDLPWWGDILAAFLLTHVTIASVTIFLHRHQAHRALELHPVASHFFRFWLWLTTGMVTREWAAIHRKHHAKCETADDPHSPQFFGIRRVLWDGAALYRREAENRATLEKYGHGTPDDWLERRLYTPHSGAGIVLMLAIDLVLFGAIGLTIWAVQMMWIPVFAAGVINGIGHYWGYRNYEVADASRNIVPWGVLIGGEELHNNHHTFAGSAKLSSKWWEVDIGWFYIRLLAASGLARVRRVPPALTIDRAKQRVDLDTVRAVLHARFQVMAQFAREVLKRVHREEMKKLRADTAGERWTLLRKARRLLVREAALLDDAARERLALVLDSNDALRTVYTMKQKLADIWNRRTGTQEHRVRALQDWCREAEATGIHALRGFAARMRSYSLAGPVPT
jgi:stearoyl-CoA desaturase (Delta-9 desaturase)